MKPNTRILASAIVLLSSLAAQAGTVAYWRFEEGPADANVPHGGLGGGVWYAGTMDSSGNGNHLSVFAEDWAGFAYRSEKPYALVPRTGETNNFSVQNTGSYPAMWTNSTTMRSMTPLAWTIEASYRPQSGTDGNYRTVVGRDSRYAATQGGADGNLAALYFQAIPNNAFAIKYCDVAGWWHEAVSATGVLSTSGVWHHLAAVCDGTTLSLYLKTTGNYNLIAQTNMASHASTNKALTAGLGSGGDWTAGDWTVGRGLYGGGHGDRAYGHIDEVRISDSALAVADFLASPDPTDADFDGLPTSWETANGLNPNDGTGVNGASGDLDGDGYTNLQEYEGGSLPNVTASTPLDTDGDGLADAWEIANFANLTQSGTDDPDGDLATNEQEETASSNPNKASSWPDSDADGMNDAWETATFGSLAKDGTADTDSDGFTDLEEFVFRSDPNVSTFSPPWPSLAHRWTFDGTLHDSVGSSDASVVEVGANNVSYNDISTPTGITITGGDKGISDYVVLGSHLLQGKTTGATIELWATPNAVQNWSRIFDFHSGQTESLHMAWTTATNIATDQVEWVDGPGVAAYNTNQPFTTGVKFHIILTIEPGAGTDGKTLVTWYSAAASNANLGASKGSFETAASMVSLNDLYDTLGYSPWPDNVASATYDEVRVWNGVLREYAREELHDKGPTDPTLADADSDGLPDSWEDLYGLSTLSGSGDHGPDGNPDADSTDNRHELLYDTDPTNPLSNAEDRDADGLVDAWEVAHFGDLSQEADGDYDGDHASNDEEETAGTDPILASSFPDTDSDGLCDGWENYYFFDLSKSGTDDVDGDGFNNLAEQTAKTDPINPLSPGVASGDADNDGLGDRWEVDAFGDITSQSGSDDPDSDGATNLAEYQAMSDPNDPVSTPTDVNGDGAADHVQFLGFDASGSGLLDKNGAATGLTQRLANTGTDASFTPNDPNLELNTSAGTLAITSTTADVNGQAGMAVAEMLGIPLSSLAFTGTQDFKARAVFVNLPAMGVGPDQLGIFAGGSSTAVVRGGRIDVSNTFGTNTNGTNDANSTFAGTLGSLAAGLSATVEISRTSGTWLLSVNGTNITPSAQPSFLDALSDLTLGVFVADVGTGGVHKTATLESFTVVVMGNASPDSDGDGLDDAWETAHFGNTTAQDGGGDPDDDGANNLAEYLFDGDPNNPADKGKSGMFTSDTDTTPGAELILTVATPVGLTFAGGPDGVQSASTGTADIAIEGSLDLASFASPVSEVTPAITDGLAAPSATHEYHSFRLDASQGLVGKGFLRARGSVSGPVIMSVRP